MLAMLALLHGCYKIDAVQVNNNRVCRPCPYNKIGVSALPTRAVFARAGYSHLAGMR